MRRSVEAIPLLIGSQETLQVTGLCIGVRIYGGKSFRHANRPRIVMPDPMTNPISHYE